MIRTENLGARFGDQWALRGVTLTLEKGSVTGLAGPAGAGKSTLLKVLAGLQVPAEGAAWIGGDEVGNAVARVQRRIGYMPDQLGTYESLKVEEYLNFYADCHRLPGGARRDRRLENLLELVDLRAKRAAYVHTLSRGMKQRLCLARCLIHDPEVLLLDEPAAGLDPDARLDLRDLLRELQALGKTILLSSHLLDDLEELCTNIAVLDEGRLVYTGPLAPPDRRYALRVAEGQEAAIGLIDAFPGASAIDAGAREIRFSLKGDAQALLRALVAAGLPVEAFHPVRSRVEELYRRMLQDEPEQAVAAAADGGENP